MKENCQLKLKEKRRKKVTEMNKRNGRWKTPHIQKKYFKMKIKKKLKLKYGIKLLTNLFVANLKSFVKIS